MQINIRKACAGDFDAIAKIYDHIHTAEEQGPSRYQLNNANL